MKNLARQGCTHDEVYNALHALDGSRNIDFRYDVIRNGVKLKEVDVKSASISFNSTSEINRSARFEFVGEPNIDWLTDMIKPYMLIKVQKDFNKIKLNWDSINNMRIKWRELDNKKISWEKIENIKTKTIDNHVWIEFPLGVFMPSTPVRNFDNGLVTYNVEAYDKTLILKEDCIDNRLFIKSGTKYIDAVKNILQSAGVIEVNFDMSDIMLTTDREFDIGTSKLVIINILLSEINYEPLTVDADGIFVLKKYVEPSNGNVTYSYIDNELSVIENGDTMEQDFFNTPNVFIAVVSNPELDKDITSIYINDNPTSKLSVTNRKRKIVSEVLKPDIIPSQEELDKYVKRVAFARSQVFEKVTFQTALMPIHEHGEVLYLHNDDLSGVYNERSWDMDLSIDGVMRHTARRLVLI